jgi:hypothetical protein
MKKVTIVLAMALAMLSCVSCSSDKSVDINVAAVQISGDNAPAVHVNGGKYTVTRLPGVDGFCKVSIPVKFRLVQSITVGVANTEPKLYLYTDKGEQLGELTLGTEPFPRNTEQMAAFLRGKSTGAEKEFVFSGMISQANYERLKEVTVIRIIGFSFTRSFSSDLVNDVQA